MSQSISSVSIRSAAKLNRSGNSSSLCFLIWMTAVLGFVCAITSAADAALIAHWKLDENTGQTAADSVGSFDGQLGSTGGVDANDPAWFTPSKIGTAAMDFTASQIDRVQVAHDPGLIEGTQMTASAWIRRGRTGVREMFMAKGNGNSAATTSFWLELNASNQFVWWMARDNGDSTVTPSSLTSVTTLTDTSGWNQIVASYDGSTKRLYLNGAEIASQAFTMTGLQIINETSLPLGIGMLGVSSLPFDGLMDDVGLWTDALTPAEVNATYTLANQSELIYDLSEAQELFDLHAAATGQLMIGDDVWNYDDALAGLGLTLGEVTKIGDRFFLLLDATTGVSIAPVPEPSSLLLLGLGALGLSIRGRRRRPVARKKTSSDVSLSSVPVTSIQGVSPMTRFASLACCLLVALVSLVWLPTVARATAIADVSEIGDYVQLYQHTFPENANYTAPGDITYAIDNSLTLDLPLGFTRVGYYMELESVALGRQWVWASMDTISSTLSELGIPLPGSGITYQQLVSNMNVESNVAGIVTGTGIQTGNIEMWSSSYGGTNAIGIPNATSSYDFGDSLGTNGTGYGSFQIHNYDLDGAGAGTVGQTLLAFNGWTHSQIDNLGIGNNPSGTLDWTLVQNANTYTLRSLEIFVLPTPTPEPSSFLLLGLGALGMVRHTRRRRRAGRSTCA